MESRELILDQIGALAGARINDAVRLAYLSGEDAGLIGGLDLSAVTEYKRNKDGGVELKFLDRMAALQWLAEHSGGDPAGRELNRAIATGGAQVWGTEE